MITRFRVEGSGAGKQELADDLSEQASRIINLFGQDGEWECTDDVISRSRSVEGPYVGRMVFKFHPKDEPTGRIIMMEPE